MTKAQTTNPMNTETKHTPGPWIFTDQLEVTGQSIYVVGYTDETGERSHDIKFLPPISDWCEAHANARLIASAPDMAKEIAQLKARVSELAGTIHAAHGLLSPLHNQITPSLLAIREATSILRSAYREVHE